MAYADEFCFLPDLFLYSVKNRVRAVFSSRNRDRVDRNSVILFIIFPAKQTAAVFLIGRDDPVAGL